MNEQQQAPVDSTQPPTPVSENPVSSDSSSLAGQTRTTDTPAHTPTPWCLFDFHFPGGWHINQQGGPGYIGSISKIPHRAQECEANARHIVRCVNAHDELLAALQWMEQFHARDGEDAIERFERVAAVFHRETGYLRPGKDCRVHSPEVRADAWGAWMEAGRARARAAIARATGDAA